MRPERYRSLGQRCRYAVESGEGDFVALTFFTYAIEFRNFAIAEREFGAGRGVDSQFFFFFAYRETGSSLLYDERGDSLLTLLRLRVRVDDCGVGCAAVGDPSFRAVDYILAVFEHGFGREGSSVGARLRLGKGEASDFLATSEWRQKLFLLVIRTEFVDGSAIQGIVGGQNHASGCAGAGNLFNHDGVTDVIHARAAFSFGNGHAGESEFSRFLEKLAGEFAFFVVFTREGLYFRFGEVAHTFLQELLFFDQFEVQG